MGGGIAPTIADTLQRPCMDAFIAKGRMRRVLEAVPVRVIPNDRTDLLGAARWTALRGA